MLRALRPAFVMPARPAAPGPVPWALGVGLALIAGCAGPKDAPVTRETAAASVVAPVPGASSAGAVLVPSAMVAATAELPPAVDPSGSVKRPAAPGVDVHAPIATAAAPPIATPSSTPSAVASSAPSAAPVVTAAPSVEAAPPALTVESPKVAEGSFQLWMQAAGKYKVGQPGIAQVVLTAQGAFHCNDKFPYKLKLGAPPAGVSYPQPIVRGEAMSISPARSVMTVPFLPTAPGDAKIGGTFYFSVCSASSCQLESREVAVSIKVEP
ncbi:MAG: hypothetical protein U0359_10770 [Byssovorax sp.]